MKKKLPAVLFSTQTEISLYINENFYNDIHFMYCSPTIGYPVDSKSNPPSSTPIEKYKGLSKESRHNDDKGAYISNHRSGLFQGIDARFSDGTIDLSQQQEIVDLIKKASPRDYRPVLCQIDIDKKVINYLESFTYPSNPLSKEYLFKNIPGKFITKQFLEED